MKANIQKRIDEVNKEIERMQDTNDGSLQWVDDLHALYVELCELEMKLFEGEICYE